MNNTMELAISFAIGGIVGAIIYSQLQKHNVLINSKKIDPIDHERLSEENKKLRKRTNAMEDEIKNLLANLDKMSKSAKESSLDLEETEVDLQHYRKEIKNLKEQNDELNQRIEKYKIAVSEYAEEIKELKNRM